MVSVRSAKSTLARDLFAPSRLESKADGEMAKRVKCCALDLIG